MCAVEGMSTSECLEVVDLVCHVEGRVFVLGGLVSQWSTSDIYKGRIDEIQSDDSSGRSNRDRDLQLYRPRLMDDTPPASSKRRFVNKTISFVLCICIYI